MAKDYESMSDKQKEILLKNKAPAWEKGKSGNEQGRPVGSRNRATLLNEALDLIVKVKGEKIAHPLDPTRPEMSWEELVVARLLEQANKGKIEAIREILDTKYGKIKDKTEITGLNDGPIAIVRRVVVGKAPDAPEESDKV